MVPFQIVTLNVKLTLTLGLQKLRMGTFIGINKLILYKKTFKSKLSSDSWVKEGRAS